MNETPTIRILYEDEACLVAEKPQGIPAEDGGAGSLPSLLRAYRTERGENAEIYPVHRLDKPTGGAILYAKTKEAAARLSAAVAAREMGKRYLAVVVGVPDAGEGRLSDFLYHDKRQNKVFVVKGGRKGAKEAILDYRVIGTAAHGGECLSLVEVTLLTGRTHQIRAQFASRRMPVYGDRRYGAGVSLSGGRIALWSHALNLGAAGNGGGVHAVSFPPREHPWSLFCVTDAQSAR